MFYKQTQLIFNDILSVERAAFKRDIEVNLTEALLSDPSAESRLSLMACVDNQPVGHILFTLRLHRLMRRLFCFQKFCLVLQNQFH
ncbi:MAG: hypothetical protein P8Y18_10590 [Candidatus Bathyarchaeota archaeon]